MQIRGLETRLKKIQMLADKLDSSEYEFQRDKDANLIIKFYDNKVVKLPILKFRPHQLEVAQKLFGDKIKKIFVVRPRRSGKEVESWTMILQGAITSPGLYMMIYPTNVRARIVLWEGSISLDDVRSLKFLDMIPKRFIDKINNQDMSITLVNGSVIRVIGSDIDPDKLRGVNVKGAVFSEYAYSDPRVLHILMPVFRQNNGWFILQTTFNGLNHAYKYYQMVKNDPTWFCRIDSVETIVDENGQRYITDAMIDDDRKSGMPEFMIQQEYYSVVQVNHERLYFSAEISNILANNKLVPNLISATKVRMFMDIGMNDSTACILHQLDPYKGHFIIGYTEANNKSFEYYIKWAEEFCVRNGLYLFEIYVPHDGQKRDFNTGKNSQDFGRDLGYRVIIVPRPASKFNAIQSMRRMLYKVTFNKENTERLIDCLSNYTKEYDLKNNIYKDAPCHDWTSHAVDAFQTMTLAIDANMLSEKTHEILYIN